MVGLVHSGWQVAARLKICLREVGMSEEPSESVKAYLDYIEKRDRYRKTLLDLATRLSALTDEEYGMLARLRLDYESAEDRYWSVLRWREGSSGVEDELESIAERSEAAKVDAGDGQTRRI